MFLLKSYILDERLKLFWKMVEQITGRDCRVEWFLPLIWASDHKETTIQCQQCNWKICDKAGKCDGIAAVVSLRNAQLPFLFVLDWIIGLYSSFLLPNKWFNIPMPRHIRHKKKILYKPMRCPVGIGSKPFIDDTNCCITHIDEPLDSLVFCGLCKININSSRFSKQGTKFGPLSYSFLVSCSCCVLIPNVLIRFLHGLHLLHSLSLTQYKI